MACVIGRRSRDSDLKVVTKKLRDTLGATARIDPLKNELRRKEENVADYFFPWAAAGTRWSKKSAISVRLTYIID